MIWIGNAVIAFIGFVGAGFFWTVGAPSFAIFWLALVLAGFAAYQSLFAQRLYLWAKDPEANPVPTGHGKWGETFDRMSRFVRSESDTQKNLVAEIEQVRATLDRLPDGLVVLNNSNIVQWRNRAGQDLMSIFSLRRSIHQFIRQPEFKQYLASDKFDVPLVMGLPSRPGRSFEIRIHLTDDDNKLIITRDITEQAKLDAMRTDFVANVSHEIRTPVTVIGGFAETMLDLDLDLDKRREYLRSIVHNSQTMQRLVEDLLLLSSLEAATDDDNADEKIKLHSLFMMLIGEAKALSSDKHNIEFSTPGAATVIGKPQEIESAVRNLLTNAVRYTGEGGTVSLRWELKDGEGWISVSDSGIGISAEHLPRLSERFYRVDRGRSRSTGGTGLGLAIVKHIANRHGASLHIDSTLGEGSTFSLILPSSRISA